MAACEATNKENLDGFLDCFTADAARKLRKPAAMLFVQHDVSMELLDSQVIEQGSDRSEVAVKYRTARSEHVYTVVSLVDFKKEDDYWKIAKERIRSVEYASAGRRPSSCFSCFGGQCQAP